MQTSEKPHKYNRWGGSVLVLYLKIHGDNRFRIFVFVMPVSKARGKVHVLTNFLPKLILNMESDSPL